MSCSNSTGKESVKLNGIYAHPVDLNTLIKIGKYKIKVGEHGPNLIEKGTDALLNITKHNDSITQSLIILNGPFAGKTYTRASFDCGKRWTEYISSVDVLSKLNRDFETYSKKDSINPDDLLIVWSGKDNYSISAQAFQSFMMDSHNRGYIKTIENLNEITNSSSGDFIIIEETNSIWIWSEDSSEWVNTNSNIVTSVNKRTGDVEVTLEELLGLSKDQLIKKFIDLSAKIDSLSNRMESIEIHQNENSQEIITSFGTHLMYFYTGTTIDGQIQIIPDLKVYDKIILTLGGITLSQDSDYFINEDNKVLFINPKDITAGNIINIFKIGNSSNKCNCCNK